jgi:hypothetical protein
MKKKLIIFCELVIIVLFAFAVQTTMIFLVPTLMEWGIL